MSEAIQMWWRAHAIARLLSRARQLPGSPAAHVTPSNGSFGVTGRGGVQGTTPPPGGSEGVRRG